MESRVSVTTHIKRLEIFEQNFNKHFLYLLHISYGQAGGLIPQKTGFKTEALNATCSIGSNAAGAVPVIGSFVGAGMTATDISIQKGHNAVQQARAQNITTISSYLPEASIKSLIKRVGMELLRIYEDQINFVCYEEVVKLAKAAATMIVSYLKDSENPLEVFNRNTMLRAVVKGLGNTDKESIRKNINGEMLTIPAIFTLPLIEKKCGYLKRENQSKKYGYRQEILFYDDTTNKYSNFTELDGEEFEISGSLKAKMSPYFQLCHEDDLLSYQEYLAKQGKSKSGASVKKFNVFFQEKYGIEHPIKLVYRDNFPCNMNLDGGDFSDTDFLGVKIENLSAKNACFDGCIFTSTIIINSNFKRSSFNSAKLDFSVWQEQTSFKQTKMNGADLSFTKAEPTIDFSEITERTGMIIEGFNINEIKKNTITSFDRPLYESRTEVVGEENNAGITYKEALKAVNNDRNLFAAVTDAASKGVANFTKSSPQEIQALGKEVKDIFIGTMTEKNKQELDVMAQQPGTNFHRSDKAVIRKNTIFSPTQQKALLQSAADESNNSTKSVDGASSSLSSS